MRRRLELEGIILRSVFVTTRASPLQPVASSKAIRRSEEEAIRILVLILLLVLVVVVVVVLPLPLHRDRELR